MNRYFFQAVGILAGTAMGAGIFALPYVFSEVGVLIGILFLALFALVYFGVHLMYAKVLQKSGGGHHFLYLAEQYLPRSIARLGSFLIIAGLLFALLIYLALAPSFARLLFGIEGIGVVFIFWIIGSIFIFLGLSKQSWAGFLGVVAMAGIVIVVLSASFGKEFSFSLVKDVDLFMVFLPFGPILFSLSARSAVPQVVSLYREARKRRRGFSLPFAIFTGTVFPAVVYVFFVFAILRLSPQVSPQALDGFYLSPLLMKFLGALGLVAIWTSHFVIGRNVRDILKTDLHVSRMVAGAVPLCFPLVFYLLGFTDFLTLVSLAGGIFLALEGVFVVTMWGRVFSDSRWYWVRAPIYAVFLLAFGYEVISYVSGI
ncbi:hypothetical protein CL629_02565 [bacterium]|nr:hypothetical protein [bacterium]